MPQIITEHVSVYISD